MSTLLLRLAAPLQSWGTESKFIFRTTNREPSKSGVIGILAAALGFSRNTSLKELDRLRFGVRVEQEGNLLIDYHTVDGPFMKERNKNGNYEATIESYRHYLSDAVFLVGLEGERNQLEKLEYAITHPVFPLYLGRRSCPPMPPVVLGIRDCDLRTALRDEPWQALDWFKKEHKDDRDLFLRIQYEPVEGESYQSIKRDLPISFDQSHRQYGYRGYTYIPPVHINTEDEQIDDEEYIPESKESEEHDPMKELEE